MRERLKKLSPRFLITGYKAIRYTVITMLFYLFRLFPIRNSRIVFMNVWGFGDNVKYVAEEAVRQNISGDMFFICNHPQKYSQNTGLHFLRNNSIPAVFALATAKVWVESNRMEAYIRKRKKQQYIQLWHGGLPLKKIEGDCASHLGETYINRAKKDSANTTLYVSNGEFCTNMYRRAFFYSGKILEAGTPRMDFLLSKDKKRKEIVRKELGLPNNCKVALYAPTYRDGKDISVYQLDYDKLSDILRKRFGQEWYVVVRLHPLVQKQSASLTLGSRGIDASTYHDFYDLLNLCDTLITDYSNCMFEGGMTQKAVFLYAKDLNQYEDERGFYFEFDKLPFPIAVNQEQLFQNISEYDNEKEQQQLNHFFSSIGIKESGTACLHVVQAITEMIHG